MTDADQYLPPLCFLLLHLNNNKSALEKREKRQRERVKERERETKKASERMKEEGRGKRREI